MQKTVTVLGLGAIGYSVAEALAEGAISGLSLHSVAAGSAASARSSLARMGRDLPILGLDQVDLMGGIVVECLPPSLLPGIARAVPASGRSLVIASIGGLLRDPGLLDTPGAGSGRIILPAGALGGLDAVRAIARHPAAEVRLTTTKPVSGFEQTADLTARGIELAAITGPTCLFDGHAEQGVRLFPKNVNVVAALALAGIGPDRTWLSLYADPAVSTNTHRVTARSPVSSFMSEITNLPDPNNPRTSAITAQSILATLQNLARGWHFM